MKKETAKRARLHHSETLDKLLALSKPEELERTQNRMILAAKIYKAMTEKGLTKKQFAELAGVSPSVVTKWLSGDNNFTVDTLTDIQRVLGVNLLALDEMQSQEFGFEVTVVALEKAPSEENQSRPGQSFSLPAKRADKTFATLSKLQRETPVA